MNKKLLTLLGLLVANSLFAEITIDPASRTFDKSGGANSVLTGGDGTWTASANVDWITVSPRTSGNAGESCVYIVDANFSADTRVGTIIIGGQTHTVTQTGYDATLDKYSENFTKVGGTGEIAVTVDNNISWTATSHDDWITLKKSSGYGAGKVEYEVAPYTTSVVARSGTITIGGNTFVVVQSGRQVTVNPSTYDLTSEAKVLLIPVTALSATTWNPRLNASWVTIIDKGSCVGDGTITVMVARNEGWIPRTTTMDVGDAVVTIYQEQASTFDFAIDPVNATADPKGVYGKVNVIAPSDSPWTAESCASWITLSSGESGAGNGTVGYVASANPTVESRTGQIRFKPVLKSPEIDYYTGFYDGNTGWCVPSDRAEKDFTVMFSFYIGELGAVNRIGMINGHSIYFDIENRLYFDTTKTSFSIDKIGSDNKYTILVRQNDDGLLTVFVGEKGQTLNEVLSITYDKIFTTSMPSLVYNRADLPTPGSLMYGSAGENQRIWLRALTDREARRADAEMTSIYESVPKYIVQGVNWDLFTLDGHVRSTDEANTSPQYRNAGGSGWAETTDRFGLRQKALCSTGNAEFHIDKFNEICHSSDSVTYSFWVYLESLPLEDAQIFRHGDNTSSPGYVRMYVNKSGYVGIHARHCRYTAWGERYLYGDPTLLPTTAIKVKRWTHITMVGTANSNIKIYIDGIEIGNLDMNLINFGRINSENNIGNDTVHFGGYNGALDEITFYHAALTSQQVRELYAAGQSKEIYHTVAQGIVDPELDTTNIVVSAAGGVEKVNLTLPMNVNWTAQSNTGWIVIPTSQSGVGSAEISLNVTANPSVLSRSGSVTIAGKTVNVFQRGLESRLSYETKLISTDGGDGTVDVYTEGSAAWTAVSDVSWISIAVGGSGSGNGTVRYVVDPYTITSASRTGTITIAGKKLYITQRGYELSVDPAVTEIGCNAGQGQFGISASLDVVWSVLITVDWITIVGDKTGNGDGTLYYSVAPNTTGATRTGKIIVSGEEYTITQLSTLAITTTVKGHGVVSGGGGYKQGDEAVLRATPDDGYAFSCWTGDATGTDNPIQVTVDVSKFVTATFVPIAVKNPVGSTEDTTKVVVSWTALPWANTYRIYRSDTMKKPNTIFVTLPQGSTSYDDTSVGPGETYYYWIEAVSDDSLSCTEAISGTRAVKADVTVTFNANGGTGEMDNLAFASGIPRTLTACAFTRTGYTFVGWSRTSQGSVVFTDKQSVTDPGEGGESKVTLYAQWAANVYAVKFSANGGSGDMSDQSFTYDTAQALTANKFTNGDSDFIGWATVANGSVVYKDQQSVKNLITKAGGIVYLYAVWGADVPTYGPWGESDAVKNVDKLGPTYLMNMPLTILGEAAAMGDSVAVYRQDTGALCGLGKVLDDSGKLTLVCYAPSGVTLHFKAWVATSGINEPQIYDCDTKCDLVAPASGAFLTGHTLVVSDKVDLTLTLKWSDDWHIISFNVEPDEKSTAAVFGEVADKIQAVTQGIEFWMPGMASSLNEIQVGKAYWVKATQDSVTWTVSGRVKPDTAITLEEGWNLIGYTLQDAGNITDVLKTALAAGAIDFITYGVDFYPGVLTKMEPGKGYWVHATKAYTLIYDEPAAAPAPKMALMALAAPASSVEIPEGALVVSPTLANTSTESVAETYGPWGTSSAVKNNDRLGPTCLTDMSLKIRDVAASQGDCVAVYREDTEELCGLGKVLDGSGKLTAVCYAPANTRLRFKAYSAASGEVIDCDASSDLNTTSVGSITAGHRLNAEDRLAVAGVTVGGRPLKVNMNYVSGELATRFGSDRAALFVQKFGFDLSTAMLRTTGKFGANGEALSVWQDYVAGTDPTDANSKFSVKIDIKNGKPEIKWEPELSAADAAKRTYTTYGKKSLSDANWTPVSDTTTSDFQFFKVGVELK